jgi:hypothetical protein
MSTILLAEATMRISADVIRMIKKLNFRSDRLTPGHSHQEKRLHTLTPAVTGQFTDTLATEDMPAAKATSERLLRRWNGIGTQHHEFLISCSTAPFPARRCGTPPTPQP